MFRGIFVYKMFEKCQFWISKRHRTIHYSKEFESDLCDAIWELKILPKMYELISALPPRILLFLKVNLALNITLEELQILSITRFHKLFKCLNSFRI